MSVFPNLSELMPQCNDIERAVIGSMIIDKDSIMPVISVIDESDLYKPEHRLIFRIITAMNREHTAIDFLTICERLKQLGKLDVIGGSAYIIGLQEDAVSSATVNHYCNIIIETSKKRKLLRYATAIQEEISKGDHSADEIAEKVQEKLIGFEKAPETKATLVSDVIPTVIKNIEKRIEHTGETSGIPTGFTKLDRTINGLRENNLILIAAKTANGKTSFALDVAKNVSFKGYPVVIFSLEMAKDDLTEALIRNESRVELSSLAFREVSADEKTEIYRACRKLSENKCLFIDDMDGLSISKLESRIQEYITRYGIKVVIVDYLQLLTVPKGESRRIEVENISRNLKRMAKKFMLPIIALSQFSRKLDEDIRRPRLSDLRDSGALEQDSDIVIFIHNPTDKEKEEYDQTVKYKYDFKEYNPMNIKELIVEKNRRGRQCRILLYWHEQYTRFSNLEY